MAADTTILSGDVGVWWLSNNRAKMLTWEGTTGTYTMNQLYSAMQTLQDESDTIDDGTCFNADTPTEYTTGKIDANDAEPWYISFDLMEHITGGSLRTTGWAHVNGTNAGIVIVQGTNVDIVASDIGNDISGGTDGNGTLLELIEGFRGDFLVIRPDSSATGDEFSANQTLTCNGHTFTQSATEDQNTGNMVWANIYTIGTVDDYVHMYVYQGERDDPEGATSPATDSSQRLYSVNSTTADYWGEGHIDVCVPINRWWRNASDGAWNSVDSGYLKVFARKGGDLYASFSVLNSTTSGGRNPVPLQTASDLNQGTGIKTISFTGAVTGSFTNRQLITGGTSGGRGIIDVPNSTLTSGGELSYFPIAADGAGGVITALQSGETVSSATGSVTTDGTPQAAGPSIASWFTNAAFPDVKFGYTNVSAASNRDIDNDGTTENWAIVVDCNDNPLSEVYEWLKYIVSYGRGETETVEQALEDDLSQSNVFGEEYVGGTAYIGYASGTPGAEGEAVTAANGATGVILCHDTDDDIYFLRNTRGSFTNSGNVVADVDSDTVVADEAANFAASTSSPFGTFAGGTFFGARGVLLDNWLASDENSFILTDIEGSTRERPTSIVITISNLWGNAISNADADLATCMYLDGSQGNPDKDLLTCDGGEVEGGTTIATSDIPDWVPSSGRLLLTDVSTSNEYVIGYSSWNGTTDTFTLDSTAAFAALTGSTDANTLVSSTDELDGLDRGDFIWNETQNAGAYVASVNTATNTVELDRDITGQTSADTIKANVVPVTLTASDTVLPFIIHAYPTSTTTQASIIYPGSTVYFRVRVRNTREDDLTNGPIKPFSSDGETSGTDQTVQTVRTIDTIIS